MITKVNYSEWAAPIVSVPKTDRGVRICGDYTVTINPVLEVDRYPLPTSEDLFATVSGAKYFSKLDYHMHTCRWIGAKIKKACHCKHTSWALPI